jgi:1-acyl-sn-glycerol-3-phosphate acyltransferase
MRKPAYSPVAYRGLLRLGRVLLRAWFGVKVDASGLVPSTGPLIVAANHSSFVDPVLLGCFSPRPVRFMMIRQFWEMPVIGWMAAVCGAFPVDEAGVARESVRNAKGVLLDGDVMGIFPEGGRSRDGRFLTPKPGAIILAMREGVPIVPAGISGAFEAWPASRALPRFRRRLTLRFGEPFTDHLSLQYPRDKERVPELTRHLMDRIAGLLG